jgi:hypothetical protein
MDSYHLKIIIFILDFHTSLKMESIISAFESTGISVTSFLQEVLSNSKFRDRPSVCDICMNAALICELLHKSTSNFKESSSTPSPVILWASDLITSFYKHEIRSLLDNDHTWRFSAVHSTAQQIEDFKIEGMVRSMMEIAPHLWKGISALLGSSKSDSESSNPINASDNLNSMESDNGYWENIDEIDLEGFIDKITEDNDSPMHRLEARKHGLINIVRELLLVPLFQNT